MKELMEMLRSRYGAPEDIIRKNPMKMKGCEYAIGGPECDNCYGAMNYSGLN